MKTAGRIFIGFSAAVLILWLVPWLYNLATLKSYSPPFTLYSPVIHDFTYLDREEGAKNSLRFIDRKGNVHGDEVQPFFYASLLHSRGEFPDSLDGRAITYKEAEDNSLVMTSRPREVARRNAPVYLLMESVPVRMELQDPEDALVIRKDGIKVWNMASNKMLEDKTAGLASQLSANGFVHPAKLLAGNPSHRKEYDEGYLVTDSKDQLFQIKQVDGKMTARSFPQASGLGIKQLFITEYTNHATLGYLIDKDDRMHMLRPDGSVVATDVIFDPVKDNLLVVGDLFNYTVKVSDNDGEKFYALNSSDFSLVDSMERTYPTDDEVNLCEYIFPCRIRFVSSNDGYVKPRLQDFSLKGLLADLVIILVIIVLKRRKKAS